MEYFSNRSLAVYAKEERPLPIEKVRQITKNITEALLYLHENGVAHRDIKPENILILPKGGELKIKLIDFGLAMVGDEI